MVSTLLGYGVSEDGEGLIVDVDPTSKGFIILHEVILSWTVTPQDPTVVELQSPIGKGRFSWKSKQAEDGEPAYLNFGEGISLGQGDILRVVVNDPGATGVSHIMICGERVAVVG